MNLTPQETTKLVTALDKMAEMQIPYVFGAEAVSDNPFTLNLTMDQIKSRGIDCSELVEWVFWNVLRIKVPDGSYNQFNVSVPVVAEYFPGDLVFRRNKLAPGAISHVGIYVGNNMVVEATPPQVVKRTLDKFAENGPTRKTEYAGIQRLSLDLF